MPSRTPTAGSSPDLAEAVRTWDDERLDHLLRRRPDLARPAPSSLTALASRAGARASVSRALTTLDAPTLGVLETIVVLAESRPPTRADVEAAGSQDPTEQVAELVQLALVLETGDQLTPVPVLRETLGPHPLGLGPRLADLGVPPAEGWPTTPRAVRSALAKAPEPARRMLEALTWGPPVGTVSHDIPPGARWLLDNHLLVRTSATELVLPREVALAARGARLTPAVPPAAPLPEAPVRAPETVLAESARAAEEILDQIEALVRSWRTRPVPVLRSGGVGVRELRQLASSFQLTTAELALVVELTAARGLLGHRMDEDGSWWTATVDAEDWAVTDLAQRWAELVLGWTDWARTPWLAGTRTERGVLRAALEPDLERHWAPVLRRRVLAALAAWPENSAPSAEQVRTHLGWYTAKAVPPLPAVQAILAEAAALGLTGAGGLTPAGRLLLQDADPATLAAAMAEAIPPAVAEMIIQGDLTAVVPGRPSAQLRELVDLVADVESRGPGMTVRFSADSVRRALDSGTDADELLDRLRAASLTPLPQPLEYLVRDVARSHGAVRIGGVGAYLRAEDPSALARVVAHPGLAHLGLQAIAPTALVARAGAREVSEALAEAGLTGVLEGPDGQPLTLPATVRPAVRAVRPGQPRGDEAEPAEQVIAQMRAGERRAQDLLRSRNEEPGAPADTLEALRLAASRGGSVELVMAGAQGGVQSRVVRPLTVDSGRIRVLDVRRDAEITVAAHRIAAVRPVATG
ncbi:helicase-associated domain-containing protein [Ruania zhangjianzhongii]|uniref:helicase-associated domain-containing protein n=1 Tax=Ruania zhangjianzhongii TaxID=2603206 RepID=UPI0011C9469C|nr:helicase-associated domain-containing protein [Ruania zhangjianzhongii]